jgi:hypothetical protein
MHTIDPTLPGLIVIVKLKTSVPVVGAEVVTSFDVWLQVSWVSPTIQAQTRMVLASRILPPLIRDFRL